MRAFRTDKSLRDRVLRIAFDRDKLSLRIKDRV
jgi:hypothetical protein